MRVCQAGLTYCVSAKACLLYRLEGGGLVHQEHAHNEDMGGIESLIDMDTGFSDGESDEEVCSAYRSASLSNLSHDMGYSTHMMSTSCCQPINALSAYR